MNEFAKSLLKLSMRLYELDHHAVLSIEDNSTLELSVYDGTITYQLDEINENRVEILEIDNLSNTEVIEIATIMKESLEE